MAVMLVISHFALRAQSCFSRALLLFFALALAAHAGSLRTRDGKFLEGTVQLDAPAGVKITLASGEQQKVALANLDQATFTSGAANSVPPEVAALMKGRGNGLLGTYYDRVDLSGRTVHRLDETLNFDWETGEPVAGVQKDYFSARWAGQLEAPVSGKFTFHLDADDGARLWVADRLVCDAWRLADTAEVTGEMELNAGQRYDLRVEYYDKLGPAHVRLSWAGPGIPRSIVPRSQLYAAIGTQAAEVASAHGLLAAYFRRTELDSSSAVTRIDPQLDFNWGDNAPVPDVPAQSFSARWVGRVAAQFTESYTFHVEAGGGVRLWLDGQLILDQWRDRPGEFYSTVVPLTAGQKYDLRLEHFSTSKEARMRLLWSSASQRKSPVPADALTPSHSGEPVASGARHGLLGAYFSRPDCSGEVLKRLDAQVNFDWADKPAAPGVPTEDFSVRWTGQVQAQHSENYTFHVEADDGVRVWLGDRQIMDEWRQQSTTLVSQPITLNAGQYYPITIEFYSAKPPAMAKLKWSSPSTSLGIIPASRLFPPNATGAPVSGERRLGLDRGVVTWDGSFLAAPLVSADDTALQFGGAQKDFSLSTVNVARITFQNLSAQRAAKIEPGRAGVLLVNGDFVDGEFKGLERGRVKLSSVLFGLKYFDATYEVVAVVLRGLTPGSPKFRVRTSDGSVLLVKRFSVAADGLTVEDATLRGYRVPAQELVELTQGGGTNLFSASLNLGPNSPHAEVAKAGAAAEREWKDKAEAVRGLVAAENARRSRVEADEERKARTELDAATEAERLLKGALTRLTEHQDQLSRVRNELKDAETKADAARAEAKKAAEVAEAKSGEADRVKAAHDQRKAEGVQRSKELNMAIQSRDQTLRKLNAEALQLESARSIARRKLETARPVVPGKSEDEAKAARAKAEELLKQAEVRCADAKAAREKQTAELAAKVKELESARKNLDKETSGLAAGCNQLAQERAQLRLARTRADSAVDRAAVDVASKRRSLAVAETLVAQATDKKNAAEKMLAEARATVARRARAQFK